MITEHRVSITSADGSAFDAFLAIPEAGRGPGILLLQEIFGVNDAMRATARLFAEEGYTVLAPDLFWRMERNVELGYGPVDSARAFALYQALDHDLALSDIGAALRHLLVVPACDGHAAIVGFCLGGTLALMAGAAFEPDAVAAFYPVAVQDMPSAATDVRCPTSIHLGAADPMLPPEAADRLRTRFAGNAKVKIYSYAGAGHAFFNPQRQEFNYLAAENALTHMLELFKPVIGPRYDLVALWERHAYCEFAERDADKTIETMVQAPYVNHVPLMTGGAGRRELRHFYRHYFVDVHPDDYEITLVSRTVGANRLVDEMIASFTHDRMMDYILPGIAPTGRKVRLAATGVVTFRGPKLRHEHLYYDQASLLVQVGLLDPALYPSAGVEQALKILDPFGTPSNALMKTWTTPPA